MFNPQRSGARPLGSDFWFMRSISARLTAKNVCPGFFSSRVLPGFQTGLFYFSLWVVWVLCGAYYCYYYSYFWLRGQAVM